LHASGDFFGEELEEEIGHNPSPCRGEGQARSARAWV
jgi:hypothetical protein